MIKGDERPTKVSLEEEITEPEAQAILLFKSAPLTSPLIIFRELQGSPGPSRVFTNAHCNSPIFCKISTTRGSLRSSSRRGSILSSATGI